jgi:hypothetical protein
MITTRQSTERGQKGETHKIPEKPRDTDITEGEDRSFQKQVVSSECLGELREIQEDPLDEIGQQKSLVLWMEWGSHLNVQFDHINSLYVLHSTICGNITGCHLLVMSPDSQCEIQSGSAQAPPLPASLQGA